MCWAGVRAGVRVMPRLLGDGVAMVARRVPPRSLRSVHARLVQQRHLRLPHRHGLPALRMQMQMQVSMS